MIRILGAFLAVLFTVCAMYLSAIGAGMTFRGFFDLISFFICFGIPYGCALAAYGKAIPDLKGMELMNKLFMPVAWLGTLIGWVMMLYSMSMGTGEIENMYAKLSLYTAITTITLLYGLILKVIFTTLIASKK
tara:strand:- start:28 stop:426 length:399 start_codon:yes stop_codon:yes gene_type:complete